ncbi:7486_t:CDS:10, partial [Scutellospora calospora]
EKEDNFISKLYRNNMSIVAWPIFTDPLFYTSLEEFKIILDEQESQYKNARMFLEKAKLVIHLSRACDWGSIKASLMTIRTLELKKFLNNAISFGYEQKNDNDENKIAKYLTNRDDGTSIPDNDVFLSKIFDDSTKIVHDTGLVLFEENGNFVKISSNLRKFFEEKVYTRGSIPDSEWVNNLNKFFKFIVDRRLKRVNEWFEKNLARFSKDNNEVIIINSALERETNRLNLFWNICRLKCYKCGLSCLKTSRHDDNPDDISHDCLTDHKCHHECEFKEDHPDGITPICEHFAAHDGKHECSFLHACGAPCIHAGKKNCQRGLCAKENGHEKTKGNEAHKCNSTIHYCGEPCSLNAITIKGKYECKNECMIPCEIEHDIHKCQKDVCPIECPIKNCQRQCDNKDHFHAFEENVIHFCGEEHDCQEKCEEDGICKIITEPTAIVQEETEYENKLPCCVKIPPYQFEHTGQKHVHEIKKSHKCNSGCPNDDEHIIEQENKQNFHFCDEKCPHCAYYCTMPYGHEKVDNSKHCHRLTAGDRGDFVLCHKLCENAGRHRHIDYCKTPDVCKSGEAKSEGSFEHISAPISPNPSKEKDYVSHCIFWERTGFRDPYTDLEEFKKCDHHCVDEKHYDKEKSYCIQKIFHPILDHKSEIIPDGTGYISIDGHQFSCESPTKNFGNFHIIFVVDISGSMGFNDCKPQCTNSMLIGLKDKHNNRLGAVIESVFTFIETRKNSRKSTRVGQMAPDRDTVSLVLFNHSATAIFENRSLSHSEDLLDEMMNYTANGFTNFADKDANQSYDTYIELKRTTTYLYLKCDSWPISLVIKEGKHVKVFLKDESQAVLLLTKVPLGGGQILPAILICGLNRLHPLDENYMEFLNLVSNQLDTYLQYGNSIEEEKKQSKILADLNHQKVMFFQGISHELKTPLTLMVSPLDEVINICLKETPIMSLLQIIRRNSHRLLKLINILLQFSNLESDQSNVRYRETNIAEFTRELVSDFEKMAKKLGLDYIIDIPKEFNQVVSDRVYLDHDMYETIVFNLCSNALKHTWNGHIKIRLYIDYRDEKKMFVLEVIDTGVGIPEIALPNIFQRFYRVESQSSRSHEGTGIGLAIVKELITLHGGDITVTSVVNKGTTFKCWFPIGCKHLPADKIHFNDIEDPIIYCQESYTNKQLYLEESSQWLKNSTSETNEAMDQLSINNWEADKMLTKEIMINSFTSMDDPVGKKCQVLLVDDNIDMR